MSDLPRGKVQTQILVTLLREDAQLRELIAWGKHRERRVGWQLVLKTNQPISKEFGPSAGNALLAQGFLARNKNTYCGESHYELTEGGRAVAEALKQHQNLMNSVKGDVSRKG